MRTKVKFLVISNYFLEILFKFLSGSYARSVIPLICGLQYLLCTLSLSKPTPLYYFLLNFGHRPALGTKGSSSMFLSVGIRHLPMAKGINLRPFKHNMLLLSLPIFVVKWKTLHTLPCWPRHQSFQCEVVSLFMPSTVNISDQSLWLCYVGC